MSLCFNMPMFMFHIPYRSQTTDWGDTSSEHVSGDHWLSGPWGPWTEPIWAKRSPLHHSKKSMLMPSRIVSRISFYLACLGKTSSWGLGTRISWLGNLCLKNNNCVSLNLYQLMLTFKMSISLFWWLLYDFPWGDINNCLMASGRLPWQIKTMVPLKYSLVDPWV